VKIGTLRAAAFCGALGIFVSATTLGPAKAATLLADGTYSTPGDLTRIDNGGTVLEFLDLTLTDGGFNEAGALATFPGFHLGTQAEVSALFSAFGIVYPLVLNPGDVVDLGAPANAASFVSHLGATNLGTGSQDRSCPVVLSSNQNYKAERRDSCLGADGDRGNHPRLLANKSTPPVTRRIFFGKQNNGSRETLPSAATASCLR
jgi:hypothetical protein